MSFFSDKLYTDVVKRWRGFGFNYLLLVAFCLAVPLTGSVAYKVAQTYQNIIAPALKIIPSLEIDQGKITLPAQKNIQKNQVWAWSSGDYQPLVLIDASNIHDTYTSRFIPLLILHDRVRIQLLLSTFSNKPITLNMLLPANAAGSLNGEDIRHLVNQKLLYWTLMGYIFVACFLWGVIMPFTILIALMGQFLSVFFAEYKMTFLQSIRLSGVAMVPSLVCTSILFSLSLWDEHWPLAGLVLALLYYLFALRACHLDVSVKSTD